MLCVCTERADGAVILENRDHVVTNGVGQAEVVPLRQRDGGSTATCTVVEKVTIWTFAIVVDVSTCNARDPRTQGAESLCFKIFSQRVTVCTHCNLVHV